MGNGNSGSLPSRASFNRRRTVGTEIPNSRATFLVDSTDRIDFSFKFHVRHLPKFSDVCGIRATTTNLIRFDCCQTFMTATCFNMEH